MVMMLAGGEWMWIEGLKDRGVSSESLSEVKIEGLFQGEGRGDGKERKNRGRRR